MARGWIEAQVQAPVIITEKEEVPTVTVVTATRDLFFGDKLNAEYLQETPWTEALVPEGIFTSAQALLDPQRVVVRPNALGEPVFLPRLSGEGGAGRLPGRVAEK